MAKLSVEAFLEYLRKSELTDEERLNAALSEIVSNSKKEDLLDANYVSNALVKAGIITHWHVRQLMKRKYKGFYLRQYRILDHLGTGGMSTVYLAEHTLMHRQVAIKVLPKKRLTNSAYLDQFVKEAQAIASLDHPHIVRAYDIDRYDDIHYIVMEYFEGNNLRQLVDKEGVMSYEDAANYIRQGAEGLVHAHRIGVIHRDIKPENLLANAQGTVKLLDLGLALLNNDRLAAESASDDKILGTADYLAPEQAIDSNRIDGRADIYGLGCTLYFCLTGHPPFPFGTIKERLLAHQQETPKSILLDRPDCPDDLVEICNKMMAKKPDDRFQSASEVVEVLGQWMVHHGFATPQDLGLKSDAEQEEDFFADQHSFLDDPWSATGLGNREDGSRSSAGIGSEDVVNLYGSSIGSSVDSKSETEKDEFLSKLEPKEILFSQRLKSEAEEKLDPLTLALEEIRRERGEKPVKPRTTDAKRADRATTSENRPTTESGNADFLHDSHILSRNDVSKKPDEGKKKSREEAWYRKVPFWFWALTVTGYVLATFLAGILFALLLNLK